MMAACLMIVSSAASARPGSRPAIGWTVLAPGLEMAHIPTPIKPAWGPAKLTVVRADMRRFRLRLVSASWSGDQNRTARDWAQRAGLIVAINGGLYLKDNKTSAGLLQSGRRVNNPRLNRWGAVLSFDRRSRRGPRARIIDRRCQNFPRLRRSYGSFLQSFRLLSCRGTPTMRPSARRWSIAALATDRRQRVLFLFAESAFSTWEFTENLRRLPLGIRRAMYLEGSRDAQLYVRAGGVEITRTGRCARFFGCADGPVTPKLIPNVLGLVPRR